MEGFRMRISNNQKRMVTTHILGLFLTVATPLSLSLISTPSVMAMDDLTRSVMFEKKSLPDQLKLVEQQLEQEPKIPTIMLSKKGSSAYNLGGALHDLKTIFEEKNNNVFVNDLLQHFRSEDPIADQQIAAEKAAQMMYQCYRLTVGLIADRTVDQNLDTVKLNWKAASKICDVSVISLAYQNVFKKLLEDQAAKEEKELSAYKDRSADWDKQSALEEFQLEQKHKENVDSLERKKARTEKSLADLNKTHNEIKEPALSVKQEYEQTKKIYEETIKNLTQQIEAANGQFAKEKKERADALDQKKKESEQVIEELKKTHQEAKKAFVVELSYFFEDLGTSGWKTFGRIWNSKPTNRRNYDYTRLDQYLFDSPPLLADAKSLLRLKIREASTKITAAPLEFTEAEILNALLRHIDVTGNTTISMSQDVFEEGGATTSVESDIPQQTLDTPSIVTVETPVKGTTLGAPPMPKLVSTDGGVQQQLVNHIIQQPELGTPVVEVVETLTTVVNNNSSTSTVMGNKVTPPKKANTKKTNQRKKRK